MSNATRRFGLTVLDSDQDTVAHNDYQFGTVDRELVDSILAYVTEHHVHDGRVTPPSTPPEPPTVSLDKTSGHIPPSTKVSYRCAFVDERGHELVASGIASVFTSYQIPPPSRIGVTAQPDVGSLPPGTYAYALSAYVGSYVNETTAGPSMTTTLATTGRTVIAGPAHAESSESGYNVYRRGPSGTDYCFLSSFEAGSTFIDDGLPTDPLHLLPTGNTTNTSNRVLITRVGVLPDGYTWKLYRTYDEFSWSNTLIYWGDAGSFDDDGAQSKPGGPRHTNTGSGSPPPIDLTDAAQVTGTLPAGANRFVIEHVFRFTSSS